MSNTSIDYLMTLLESERQQIYHLLVIEDKQGKRAILLEAATYSIGRDSHNSIVLYSNLVSRQHAILLRVTSPETATYLFRIVDGNLQGKPSTNGLLINGRRCFSHDLKPGDVIVFGGNVKARYYATANLSDVELLTSGKVENSGVLLNLSTAIDRFASNSDSETSIEAALVRLASFPELISNPILEINLTGTITYLNPAAVVQFPDIQEAKLQHPMLAGIVESVRNSQEKFFVREVEVANKVFEQSVHYIAESDLIRSYIVDFTERKRTEEALRESEAKNRALLNAIPDLMLRISKDGTYLDYMPAKGIDILAPASDLVGRNEYQVLPPDVAQHRMHYVEQALKTGKTQIFEYQLPLNDGSIRHEEARIVVSGEDEVLAIVRDITERKQVEALLQQAYDELEIRVEQRTAELRNANEQLRGEIVERQRAEEEVRFLQTMTQAVSESADFHSALGVALCKVCDFTGWKFGEAWVPAPDGKTLESSPAWYSASLNVEKFRQLSEKFKFPPATGLPGRVWSSKQPEWIQDVTNKPDTVFLRKQCVMEVGLKAGFGIPIIDNNQVLAVLVFFMFESCEEDKRLVEIVSTVATQLGSLVQRKRAEAALRESEERFRLLIEGVKDYAIFMLDTDGYIVSWNTGAERINGYRAEEIIGTHFSCFYLDEDIALGKPEQHLHLCQVNDQIEAEGWRVRKDGSRIWANVVIMALRDQNGKLRGFSKLTRDITERKRAEEALRESEQRLQAILDNSTALVYVKDIQGKYILINAWYSILFLLAREQVIGKTDYDIFPPEIADVFRTHDQKVLEARTPLDWEEVFPHDDGLHTYLSIKFPLYDTAGVPYAICGISTDITERKRAEEALQSSVATNRALLNAIPDSMFRISKQGTFVNFKAAKDNRLPLPPGEFLGKNLSEVLSPEVAQPIIECVEQALHTGEIQICEYQLLGNNNLRDYEARIAVSAEDEVMAIVRDITERKQSEAEIRNALEKEKELSELKSRFIAMTSHEFRTPLATILSSAELIEHYSHKWSEEKKLNHIQRIQAAAKHMSGLLNDVLLIGKAGAGKLEFKPTQIDLPQFCRELVEEMELTAGTHKIAFCSQDQSTNAHMDEKLLRHILSNLLSNAIKYSPQGCTVHFDLACEQEAIFCIQDQGIGIPVADQAQLFNSFHRASNVGTISGTGLGLAIVKKSVDLHCGTITFESEVGVGTTFTVTLPLNKQV